MWGISVRTPREDRMIVRSSFSEAKDLALKIKEKFKEHPRVVVELISRRKPFPPPHNFKPRRNHLWCPYCGKERVFYMDKEFNILRCPVCSITEQAFWVRTHNHLWPTRKAKGRKR